MMLTPWLLTTVLAPTNLVPNGSFEEVTPTGLPVGWQVVSPRGENAAEGLRAASAGANGKAAGGAQGAAGRDTLPHKLIWLDPAGEPLRMDYVGGRRGLMGAWQRAQEVFRA